MFVSHSHNKQAPLIPEQSCPEFISPLLPSYYCILTVGFFTGAVACADRGFAAVMSAHCDSPSKELHWQNTGGNKKCLYTGDSSALHNYLNPSCS